MKDLRVKVIVSALVVIGLALSAVVGLNGWQQSQRLINDNGQLIETSARLTGSAYVTRQTQNWQLNQRLVFDDVVRKESFRGSIQDVERRLQSIAPPSSHEFIAIVDSSLRVQSFATSAQSQLDEYNLREALSGQANLAESRLLSVGKSVLSIHAARFSERGSEFTLVTGFDPGPVLTQGLQQALDDQIQVTVLPFGSDSLDGGIVLELDKSGETSLAVELVVPNQAFSFTSTDFLTTAGQALVVLSLAALLCSVLFTHIITENVDRPLIAIRRAVRTIKEGRLQEPVRRAQAGAFENVAYDLEAMREALCDRENRIMHHAEYDALTGLTNRSVISEKLKMAMSRADRSGTIISALAIDLSRFSEINGSMGHEVGDEVLKEIARRLASNARITDTVARVGGDEFFVILEDSDLKLAQSLAKFMVASLTTPIHVNGSEIKLNVHAGVAFFPMHCDSAEALRRMANIGLYTAKEHGKSLVIYEPGQDEKHLRELAIIHDLPNAIKNNELYLQYQPKIDMESQQVRQVEALVRWRHPQLGFIPPDEFIALLEKSGMISRLTNWVFREAIRQARVWKDADYDLGIAVNISANDLSDEKLAERLKHLLHHYLVDASKITIEVTESAVIKDPENSVKVLNELRAAGVRCSLDDFGTGQTSLALLKQLPISEIKIDKSFVQNLRADSGDAIIVKSIIDLGHNMGLHVTAEGVESNYCWNLLNSYGCNLVQGYLVSAPLTADELTEWHLRLQDRHLNKLDLSFVHDMTA